MTIILLGGCAELLLLGLVIRDTWQRRDEQLPGRVVAPAKVPQQAGSGLYRQLCHNVCLYPLAVQRGDRPASSNNQQALGLFGARWRGVAYPGEQGLQTVVLQVSIVDLRGKLEWLDPI
jgi:hypothetical protein